MASSSSSSSSGSGGGLSPLNPNKDMINVLSELVELQGAGTPALLEGKHRNYISSAVRAMIQLAAADARWTKPLVYIVESDNNFSRPLTSVQPVSVSAKWITSAIATFPGHSLLVLTHRKARLGFSGTLEISACVEQLASLTLWASRIHSPAKASDRASIPIGHMTISVEVLKRLFARTASLPEERASLSITDATKSIPLMDFVQLVNRLDTAVADGDSDSAMSELSARTQCFLKGNPHTAAGMDNWLSFFSMLTTIVAPLHVEGSDTPLGKSILEKWVDFETANLLAVIAQSITSDTLLDEFLTSSVFASFTQTPGKFSRWSYDSSSHEGDPLVELLDRSKMLMCVETPCVVCTDQALVFAEVLDSPSAIAYGGHLYVFRCDFIRVLASLVDKALRQVMAKCVEMFKGQFPTTANGAPLFVAKDAESRAFCSATRDRVNELTLRPDSAVRSVGAKRVVLPDIEDLMKRGTAAPLCTFNSLMAYRDDKRIAHEARFRLFNQLFDAGYTSADVAAFGERHARGKAAEYAERAQYEERRLNSIKGTETHSKAVGCGMMMSKSLPMGADGARQYTGCPFKFANTDEIAQLVDMTGVVAPSRIASITTQAAKGHPKVACLLHAHALLDVYGANKWRIEQAARAQPRTFENTTFPFNTPGERLQYVLGHQQGL